MLPLKQAFTRVAVLSLFITITPLFADTAVPPAGGAATGPAAAPSVFNFDSPKRTDPGPKGTKGIPRETGERYWGEEPDYNTRQRDQWLEICAPKKNVNFDAYRECYQNEKKKSNAALRESFEEKERRMQGNAYRNSGPPGDTDSPGRNPSFDVEVQSTKE